MDRSLSALRERSMTQRLAYTGYRTLPSAVALTAALSKRVIGLESLPPDREPTPQSTPTPTPPDQTPPSERSARARRAQAAPVHTPPSSAASATSSTSSARSARQVHPAT